ncbi:uncharacterized protein LOC126584363 isoform X2 [Malus sylvestris]|uniref:uncharacterized protein LOC126584363 isoform X2 n=1 Tax=Malus sylvestris TaxID=3752 RepID=UPI0021ACEFC8|nr:uncharacterized protein LOC126584363 isoform X2 [Malus sylvestris]
MLRDESSCNTYNYGDALYWDARYVQEGGSFDWYQRYSSLRPFVRHFIPISSSVLMVGCGNAGHRMKKSCKESFSFPLFSKFDVEGNSVPDAVRVPKSGIVLAIRRRKILMPVMRCLTRGHPDIFMSEDMVKDGYEDIMNIDISSVAIDMMISTYEHIPQLKYMQMDVRDMSFFPDDLFDGVIDKGTLDSLMCGNDAPISAAQMLGEVSRLLKPGGIYMLITYGDPKVRMPHLRRPVYNWKVCLYTIPRPGFQTPEGCGLSSKSDLEPVPITEKGLLPADFVLEDPDCHFIYVCKKDDAELGNPSTDGLGQLTVDDL